MTGLAVLRVVSMSESEPADPETCCAQLMRVPNRLLRAPCQSPAVLLLALAMQLLDTCSPVGINRMCPFFLPCRSRQVHTARPAQAQEVRDPAKHPAA